MNTTPAPPSPNVHANATPSGAERVSIPVTGMTCAACVARIEKNLRRMDGGAELAHGGLTTS